MQFPTHLILIWLCGWSRSGTLAEEEVRRSDSYGRYSGEGPRREPYAFAAIPLHAPVPVLHVLSSVPLTSRDRYPASSAPRPAYSYVHSYEDDDYDEPYEPQPQPQQQYTSSYSTLPYALTASSSGPEETVLYARPTPLGGYTYRKRVPRPAPVVPKRLPPVQPDEPFVLRVHKYRIVKDW